MQNAHSSPKFDVLWALNTVILTTPVTQTVRAFGLDCDTGLWDCCF